MNTIRKKYTALRSFIYVTDIEVNGRSRVITFDGGSRATKTNGFFVTNDIEEQRALEALPQFNVDFYLEEVYRYENAGNPAVPPTREVVMPAEEQPEAAVDPDAVAEPESETEVPSAETPAEEVTAKGEHSVAGVTNMAAAKMQLLGMFPEEKTRLAELKKADEIRAFANEKGVVFPDWA